MRYENYWLSTDNVEPGPPLPGDTACDVAIVGAGYTGLWTAHFLKQAKPDLDVQVLEAQYAGAGASGMNAGLVQMTAGKVLRRMLWYYGKEKARGVYKSTFRSILELDRFCRRNDIDAQLERTGILQVATNNKQLARIQLQTARANRAGAGLFEVLDAEHARAAVGSSIILGAVRVNGATVNPLRLARGLARVVRSQGVVIHEQTPVTAVEKANGTWQITTPTGTVTASQVVIATNAWQGTFPELYARQYPVWNYVIVTEPLSDTQLARVAWPGREAVATAQSFSTALRLTADNRVLCAGGLWYRFGNRETDPRHHRHDDAFGRLRQSLDAFFPQWADVPIAYGYGGLISWSHTFIPQYGRTPSGMIYGHGDTGSGIAACLTGGKILRDLVLERHTDYTKLAFVTVNQPKFWPGELGNKGADFFIWRQRVGDELPALLPYGSVLSPRRLFAGHGSRRL